MKRTKKFYKELFDNPKHLFPPSASDNGVEVILLPNGEREIWLKGSQGTGVRITAGNGPHGLGIRISRFVGGPNITIASNNDPHGGYYETDYAELCQYYADDESQQFREWYFAQGKHPA